MPDFFSAFAALAHRRPGLLAFVLGLFSATGFAPLGLWPITLASLAGLLFLVAREARWQRAFAVGWCFGVGHFALGLNWIATAFTYQAAMPAWLGWIAVLLLALFLAVYPALAAAGSAFLLSRRWIQRPLPGSGEPAPRACTEPPRAVTLSFLLAFAGLWTFAEWLRSWLFTGFAWNPLSAIQPAAATPAIWIGSYGTSALVILTAGTVLLAAGRAWRTMLAIAATLLIVIAGAQTATIFASRGSAGDPARSETARITLVQPNIGQADKWEGEKADSNFLKLARLTAAKDSRPRLVLWPEAAIPDYLETGYPPVYYDRTPYAARRRLTSLMNEKDVLMLGALRLELAPGGDVIGARNAVMTVRADGSLGPHYDKAHLVPYGEYLPLRPLLSAIGLSRLAPGDLDFWPGPGPRTVELEGFGRIGLQICYEIIFSGQVVDPVNRPDFIFNPSNDAWFGSWGPPQHLAQARLRAIEEGLPVVRSTPTGISAVIDARGTVVAAIPMHRAGRIDMLMPPRHEPTIFARWGNVMTVGFALLLVVLAIAFRRRGR